MLNQYNVLEASPAGAMWTTPKAPGKSFQTFFLTVEGVDKTVMINREAGSSLLSGPTWLSLTETPNKKGTGTYYKAKLEKAPEGPLGGAQTLPMPAARPQQVVSTPVTWGQALIAAATYVAASPEQVKLGLPAILSTAKSLYLSEVPSPQAHEEAKQAEKDVFPTDADVAIDFDEIPF